MRELDGQVAIVTGGGRGIGRAIAQALAAAGAAVVVAARTQTELDETATAITDAGGRALAVPADVTDQDAVDQLVTRTAQQVGPVDVLVHNAGVVHRLAPLWEQEPAVWWRTVEVALRGAFLCARAVLPGMVARRRGRIIYMSTAISQAVPYYNGYLSAKTALTRLAEGLAAETAEHGIAAFSVFPGTVETAMLAEVRASPWLPRAVAFMRAAGFDPTAGLPMPPEAAAQLCVVLASGRADRLSGRHLSVHDDLAALIAQAETVVADERYVLRLRT